MLPELTGLNGFIFWTLSAVGSVGLAVAGVLFSVAGYQEPALRR